MSFAYARPVDVEAAADLAAAGGVVLAGGQSLMPLINRGDIRPSLVVDINRIAGLDTIRLVDDVVEIGALVRLEAVRVHALVRRHLPVLAAALAWVANPAIRARGTLVGNLVTSGPGAEAVAAAALQGAELIFADHAGRRHGPLGSHRPQDLAVAARLRVSPPGTRAGFHEVQRRFGHLGLVGAGVVLEPDGSVGVALSGILPEPLIALEVGRAIASGCSSKADIAAALTVDLAGRQVRDDLHATARYRRQVAPVVVLRAYADARAAEVVP